jgi:hypothetical protein
MLWLVETLLSISHTTLSETDSKVLSLYPMYSLLQCIASGAKEGVENEVPLGMYDTILLRNYTYLVCRDPIVSHTELFHVSCACLHPTPGVAHFPHYPCAFIPVFSVCLLPVRLVSSSLPAFLPYSCFSLSPLFSSFPGFYHSACPDPASRSVPWDTALDY